MVLRTEVIDAFKVIGVPPDADEACASKAYRRLALLHHPDRNKDDSTSTARFQEIGAAWDICTRHYENPRWSQVPEAGGAFFAAHTYGAAGRFEDDDEEEMDEEERQAFFRMLMGGYTRSKRQRFRSERHAPSFHSYGYPFAHSSSYASSYSDLSGTQETHAAKQRSQKERENERYKQRMRELDLEMEMEARELQRVERENQLKLEQRLTAHGDAFELARNGNSSGVRDMVEKHSLDVNAPERVLKQQKKPPAKFQTLLHVAASRCSEELVSFLLDKGADMTVLNKDDLTPFHQSILSGNTSVVRYFLTRRAKTSEGNHPSKAAPDGRTPLQLAIASNSIPTLELLLKDATVHDVERCWIQPSLPVAMKDVLETKKGFVPRASLADGQALSRKAFLKAEAARKLAAQQEEKAKRIAEERARAAENLRKKEERAKRHADEETRRKEEERQKAEEAQRLAEEEQRKAEALRKAEEELREKEEQRRRAVEEEHRRSVEEEHRRSVEEERRRVEEKERRRVEEKERRRAEEEERRRVEEEERRRAEEEERRRAEEEERRRVENEERRRREEEERQRAARRRVETEARNAVAEDAGRKAAQQEERRKVLEIEARRKMDAGRKLERQREAEARQKEVEERQRVEKEDRMTAHNTQVREERKSQVEPRGTKPTMATPRKRTLQDPEAKRAETLRRLHAQAEEHERLKSQRLQAAPQTPILQSPAPLSVSIDHKQEEIMRKRAEQSARDKARHQRIKEEKARLENIKRTEQGLDPVLVSDAPKKRQPQTKKTDTKGTTDIRASQHHPSYPLTPSSISSSPVPWTAEPSHFSNATSTIRSTLLSPPMTPEDLQTCAIPDDLFVYEMPKTQWPVSNLRRVQGVNKARGGRGRGRGRGGSRSWRDNSVPGTSEAEQELARKNLEIERLSAELAAFRTGAP
ncbi:hypothetical protein FPV67DRAFT_1464526 [Lyophyllum atratum]|nr:hypothetical protein FPV67DRAFT_1464526 [Lyophyllum atratum]